jgi:hypothetical protein
METKEERKKRIFQQRVNKMKKKVQIGDKIYDSYREAARAIGVSNPTIANYIWAGKAKDGTPVKAVTQ